MQIVPLIEALSSTSAYPEPVTTVEVRQTHISAVFITDKFVYKVKKPVQLGFVDFTTIEKRHHFCQEEVRLNRRLASEVYVGVVPIVRAEDGLAFEKEGEVVDWAVKMVRLPDSATFLERLRQGEIDSNAVDVLARRIAAFHRDAKTSAHIATFGEFKRVYRLISDIFEQAESQTGNIIDVGVFAKVILLAEVSLAEQRSLLEHRARRSMPRDCHGDLHLDHVYLFPDRNPPADLVIIDCIEFNERFRYIDPIADMAFPVMDLKFEGRRDLADEFTEAYFRATGDDEGRLILPLYTAYRAMVRGMVEGLHVLQREADESGRALARRRAAAHWLLALAELEEPALKPCLVLVAGLPGTGKSTLARGLAETAKFHIIRSDVIRKELARAENLPAAELYSDVWTERTYAECLRQAEVDLSHGKRVVVDATFREERFRESFLQTATGWGLPACILLCEADPKIVRDRLKHRKGDASDADWSVYLKASKTWDEFGPRTRKVLSTIPTGQPLEEAVSTAVDALRRMHLAK